MTDLDDAVRRVVDERLHELGIGREQKRGMSVREAAERLGVDPRTVRRLIERGELRSVRIGAKAIRVLSADVDRLLDGAEGIA